MRFLFDLETWEMMSYIVTVIGLPFAILVLYLEQRREHENDEEELFQRLSEEYVNFSKLLLDNADLKLMSAEAEKDNLNEEQRERRKIIFDILISLFERAYLLVYEEDMNQKTRRLWASWEDYIQSWCKRRDFRSELDELLQGEDPDFGKYIRTVAANAIAANSTTASAAGNSLSAGG